MDALTRFIDHCGHRPAALPRDAAFSFACGWHGRVCWSHECACHGSAERAGNGSAVLDTGNVVTLTTFPLLEVSG